MPLIGPKEMFKAAYDGHYAIGAFNVNNMEIIQGIMQAAADEKSPVILQVSAGARKYAGQIYIMKLVEAALTESPEVPVCVHLDHGPSFEMCKDCASSVPHEFVEECNKYGGNVGDARGVPEDMLRRAATMGVCKINVDTDIRLALTASIRKYMVEHPEAFDPRKYLGPARDAVRNMVAHKIHDVMGSSGKA